MDGKKKKISDNICYEHVSIGLYLHHNNFLLLGFCSDCHTLPPQRITKERDIKRRREQKHRTLTNTASHSALSPPSQCMNKLKD